MIRRSLIGLTCLLLAACSTPAEPSAPAPSNATSFPAVSASGVPSSSAPRLPGPVDHVFLVIEENHAYRQIVGAEAAPYINELIARGALATDYHGVAHPSLPNYLALVAGETFGVTSDCDPTARGCHFSAASLPDRIEAASVSWRAYFDHMPAACDTHDAGNYRVHHDPFVYFDRIVGAIERCREHVVPLDRLATDLQNEATTPNFAVIVPGNDHNMHDGSVQSADRWLRETLAPVFASPAWAGARSIVVLISDEDDGSSGNRVISLFVGPAARAGYRSDVGYTHYSLLRTVENWLGLDPLTNNDRNARPMSDLMR